MPAARAHPTRMLLGVAFAALAAGDALLAGAGGPGARRWRRVTKPALMPLLAARTALDPRWAAAPEERRAVLAAQAFGGIGDLALLSDSPRAFVAGMAVFGGGHTAYLRQLRRHRARRPLHHSPVAVAAGIAAAIAAPMLARGAARTDPVLGPGILGYAALLAAVAANAGNLDPALPSGARRAATAGGLCFLVSDLMLGVGAFVLDEPPPLLETGVMLTYAAAQFLLAEGASEAA